MRRTYAVPSRTPLLLLVGLMSGPVACTDSTEPPSAASLSFVTQPVSVLAAAPISPAIIVAIHDASGNVVTGATTVVTLSVAAPSTATLLGETSVSAINGVATFRNLIINAAGTDYQLTATAQNLPAATSNAFDVLAGYPTKLGFVSSPTTTIARSVMTPSVRVAIQDAAGNTVIAASYSINLELLNPGPAGLTGITTATAVNGIATFESLSIDTPANGYSLRATAPPLADAYSPAFSVIAGAASQLVFTVEPMIARPGEPINPAVTVRVEDQYGNRVSGTTHSITVALGSNPAGGILSGTTTVNAVNGVASFSDLRIDRLGTGYTMTAASTGLNTGHTGDFTVRSALTFKHVSSGYFHSCGIATDDVSYCWGVNGLGELGNAAVTQISEPIPVSGGHTFVRISAGRSHSCGLTASGAAYCWGASNSGQIGSGTTGYSHVPLLVSGGHTFAQLTAGYNHTCGVTTAAVGYCWGGNSGGELGTGDRVSRTTPAAVGGGLAFASIIPGRLFTCGLTTGGAAYCWGENGTGALGDGTFANSLTPVAVAGGHTFTAVYAGGFHSCGLTADGSGRCWGNNDVGAVGNGSFISTQNPSPVAGGLSFASISAGNRHTCGVTAAGAGYCWGENSGGYLGNGGTVNSSSPSPTSGGLIFTSISAGRFHSCGVTTSSEAYCWGENGGGKLGDGTLTTRLVPTRVR